MTAEEVAKSTEPFYSTKEEAWEKLVEMTDLSPPEIPGDLDGDGIIDQNDLALFRSTLGKCEGGTGYNSGADYDGDCCVSYADYRIWLGYYRSQ